MKKLDRKTDQSTSVEKNKMEKEVHDAELKSTVGSKKKICHVFPS